MAFLLVLSSLVLTAAAQQDAGTVIEQALSASNGSGLVQVQLPASSFLAGAAGIINVPANTSLLLVGQGNSSSKLQWDLSNSNMAPRISVQAGAQLQAYFLYSRSCNLSRNGYTKHMYPAS